VHDSANPPLRSPDVPDPTIGFVVTTLLIVKDVARARDFYTRTFDGKVVRDDAPAMIRIANSWLIINEGGGPTDDKPTIIAAAPSNDGFLSAAINLRVADIHACYELWKSRGAQFLTEPKTHKGEIRCYIRDPDGHLIEVGQAISS
jgi:lactoylglutathione lyase